MYLTARWYISCMNGDTYNLHHVTAIMLMYSVTSRATARRRCSDGAVMVRWWCGDSAVMVRCWRVPWALEVTCSDHDGAVMVRWWCGDGAVMGRRLCGDGCPPVRRWGLHSSAAWPRALSSPSEGVSKMPSWYTAPFTEDDIVPSATCTFSFSSSPSWARKFCVGLLEHVTQHVVCECWMRQFVPRVLRNPIASRTISAKTQPDACGQLPSWWCISTKSSPSL